MRVGLLFSLTLALASTASAATLGGRPDLDRLAGVYKHRATPGFDRTDPPGEDILEIAKLSPQKAYIRIHTEDGEHICGFHGVADLAPDALVFRNDYDFNSPCTLKLRSNREGVVLDDVGGRCSRWSCGAGADLGTGDRVNFKFAEKREIRYMSRILQSREYAEAVKEHDRPR
ncbi:MAG: hypothetical protein ACXU8S_13125 [Phenylobacterium sp.]